MAIPLALGASGCTSDDASVEPGGAAIEEHNAEAAQAVNAGTTCVVLRRQGGTKAIDSFVSEEKKDNNYGASSFAGITGAAGNVTRALFRFDLGAIPSNATILNAGLSLTQNNTGAAVARVHVLNGQWDEATVTWNKLGATFGPAVTAVPNDKATMVFPVGPQVQAWIKGTVANNGFLIDQLEPSLTRFYTQEWVLVPQRPSLSVCYNVVCADGTADCNGNAADGCETSLSAPSSCGACGNACVLPHATASCAAGVCGIASCAAGFDSCDGDAQNGCETDLATLGNCGACGATCSLPHASTSCAGGACKLAACDQGAFDCDGDAANGCEPIPCGDGSHCGGSGDCTSHVCLAGACTAPACSDHTMNGAETDTDCGG
ncbi:MAG: DNRLRE domain-containing protein, partial [Minicystis sp.]